MNDRSKGIGGSDSPLCKCGCGNLAPVGRFFIQGHWGKSEKGRRHLSIIKHKNSRVNHGDGYITVRPPRGINRLEHHIIIEKIIGKRLPPKAVSHHIDENRSNNHPSNLVVCENLAYHNLLHQRLRAYKATGHAYWRKCAFCGQYDDPKNLYIPPRRGTIEHRRCGREYRKRQLEKRMARSA